MKKKIIILVLLSMCIALTGCGAKESPEVPSGETETKIDPAETGSVEEPETNMPEKAVEYKIDHFKETVKATDIKGSGYEYEEEVDAVTLSADRLLYDVSDFEDMENTDADGKYKTVFMLLSALMRYDPDDPSACEGMLEALFNSSVFPEGYTGQPLKNCAKYLVPKEQKEKVVGRFFADTGDTDLPYVLTMRSDAYEPQHSVMKRDEGDIDLYIEAVYVKIPGTEEEIKVLVYQDPLDGGWHMYSGGYTDLMKEGE